MAINLSTAFHDNSFFCLSCHYSFPLQDLLNKINKTWSILYYLHVLLLWEDSKYCNIALNPQLSEQTN